MIKPVQFFTLFLLLLSLTLVLPENTSAQTDEQSNVHVVRQGETLFSISRQHNIPVANLRAWNNLTSDNLSVGMRLRLAPERPANTITHVVQAQETLFAISRRYNVTIAEIQQWNNLRDTNLEIGQELTIYRVPQQTDELLPEPDDTTLVAIPDPEQERESIVTAPVQMNTYYIVKSGDSLYRIALNHNMSVEDLRALNQLQSDVLRVGQQLTVRENRGTPPSVSEGTEDSTPQGQFTLYTLQRGETAGDILNRFRMTAEEFKALNPGLEDMNLVQGQRYTVLLPPSKIFNNPYRKGAGLQDLGTVWASRYTDQTARNTTTSGELYNPTQLTAAHPNIALGNVIYVENPSTGNGVYVKINDRFSGDGIKLSHRAFELLGFTSVQQATVAIYQDQ
jgi:LysM repeat protein